MRHHIDGVDEAIIIGFTGIDSRNLAHHGIGHTIRATRPGINHFVIFLALRNQAVNILLLIFLHQSGRLINQAELVFRNNHIVFTKRDTGFAGFAETDLHNVVTENNRLFLTAMAIHRINDF